MESATFQRMTDVGRKTSAEAYKIRDNALKDEKVKHMEVHIGR
jgi:protein-arginine kinase activator protein McsA